MSRRSILRSSDVQLVRRRSGAGSRYRPTAAGAAYQLSSNICRQDPSSTADSIMLTAEVREPTHTHTHPFNGTFSGTTQVSRYQKGKTNRDFTEAGDSEWQWNQLGHNASLHLAPLQTDNHASTPPFIFYRPDALPATQPTASKHRRQYENQHRLA